MYVRLSGGGDDLVHFNFPKVVSVGDVIGDAAVEEDRFLGYDSHLPSQPLDVKTVGGMSINILFREILYEQTQLKRVLHNGV